MSKQNRFRVAQKIALFNAKNEILIVRFSQDKRMPEKLRGKWDFPGGGLEWDESLSAGLAREIKEELGDITIKVAKPLVIWDWVHTADSRIRTVCVLYKGTFVDGEIKLSHEHDQFQWAQIGDLESKYFAWDKDDEGLIKRLVKIIG